MKIALQIISATGLVLTIIPSMLVAAQVMESGQNKMLMLVGTILWFATVPFWMRKKG